MNGFYAVLRRELLSLWVTPLAWVVLFSFLVLQGVSFFLVVEHYSKFNGGGVDSGPIQGYFSSLFVPVTLLIMCPALTMRLFAEERRSGTLELMLTAPISAAALVWGKYLATLVTFAAMWLPTLLYVFVLRNTGSVEWSVVFGCYLGLFLIGSYYLAIGTLASCFTRNQIVALMLSVMTLFGLMILGIGERVFDPGPLLEVCRHVSILSQLDEFSRGVVDTRRIFFDVSLTLLAVFFAVRAVEGWGETA